MMRRVGLVVAARRMMAGSRSLSSVVAEDGKPYPCSWSWGRGQAKNARPLPQTPTLVYDSLRGCIHEWGSSVYLLRCALPWWWRTSAPRPVRAGGPHGRRRPPYGGIICVVASLNTCESPSDEVDGDMAQPLGSGN